MRFRTPFLCSVAALLSTAAVILPVNAAPAQDSGPALTEPPEVLAGALSCPATFRGQHEPVLLVHATAETGQRNFSDNYGRVLPRMGYDVCTIELVDYARGDIQASAERVVYAVRTMAQRSGRKVQIIGHSEGPLPARWAIKWWPDVASLVDDLISIAGPYHGWFGTEAFCSAGCAPALWQMRRGSKFMAVFNAGDETPGDVSYTSVYSVTDEVVQPYSTTELEGGANIRVQDACPGRVTEHYEMVYDAAVYAAVIDALTHPGPAVLDRLDRSLCGQLTMPGTTVVDLLAGEFGGWIIGTPLLVSHAVDHEPPLAPYAQASTP